MDDDQLYFNILNRIYQPYQPRLAVELQGLGSFRTLYQKHGGSKLRQLEPEKEFEKVKKLGLKIITRLDQGYPESLKNIPNPPLGFYLLGQLPLNFPLAIVGTRKAGHYGLMLARKFASQLSQLGAVIVSGLAYGIDGAAQTSTVESNGQTIAILGEGIDQVLNSPKRNLVDKILATGGGVISEFSLGTVGLKGNFPLRNRIISGLSLGVIVIEAPIDSGALITARCALEQGKEVFVVPAEVVNRNYEGSHRLIQQGAKLVTSIEDVLTEFDFKLPQSQIKALRLSAREEEIYELLKTNGATLLELQEGLKMSTGELLALLTHLEIKAIIKNVNGKFIAWDA